MSVPPIQSLEVPPPVIGNPILMTGSTTYIGGTGVMTFRTYATSRPMQLMGISIGAYCVGVSFIFGIFLVLTGIMMSGMISTSIGLGIAGIFILIIGLLLLIIGFVLGIKSFNEFKTLRDQEKHPSHSGQPNYPPPAPPKENSSPSLPHETSPAPPQETSPLSPKDGIPASVAHVINEVKEIDRLSNSNEDELNELNNEDELNELNNENNLSKNHENISFPVQETQQFDPPPNYPVDPTFSFKQSDKQPIGLLLKNLDDSKNNIITPNTTNGLPSYPETIENIPKTETNTSMEEITEDTPLKAKNPEETANYMSDDEPEETTVLL